MAQPSLGTRVDKLYKLKEQIDEAKLELSKTAAAKKLEKLEKKYKEEESSLMDNIPKQDLDGALGKIAMAKINTLVVGNVTDWDQVYKFIKRTNGFDLLNKAFNNKAYRDRLENNKKVPGVKPVKVHKLSLTKRPK